MATETTETTPVTPEVQEQSGGYDEAGAMQALLSRWKVGDAPEPPKKRPYEQPDPEQAEADAPEAEAAADAESTSETPQEEADFELDVGGAKFRVPKAAEEPARAIAAKVKEIEAGATRKFQEAAELRKATEAERASVAEMRKIAETQADLLADHRAIVRRMQQLEGVDIHATEADQLARYNAEYTQLNAAKQRVEQAFTSAVAGLRNEETKAKQARMQHAEQVVAQRLKGWGPEMQKELAEYAVGRGAPVEALQNITEPWMVEILADAAYGRKMREHKATTEKRVAEAAKPVVKPGAAQGTKPAAQKAVDAMSRLKKSGKPDDAVAALLARSMLKR